MKRALLLIVMISALSLWAAPATATLSLSLESNGSIGSYDLVVSGLGEYLPSTPLSSFDVYIKFGPSLSLDTPPQLGTGLGLNPSLDLFDPIADAYYFYSFPETGLVRLYEQSWLFPDELAMLQSDQLTLATFTFVNNYGNRFDCIGISGALLTDAYGNTMPTVPEPATLLLLGFGLAGMAGVGSRWKNA